MKTKNWTRLISLFVLLALLLAPLPAAGQVEALYKTDLPTPAGSGAYGKQVAVLPNGNIVVTDPDYSTATVANVGAVYLYDGETFGLISVLTGSHTDDAVGSGGFGRGIHVLSSGDFVVLSPIWDGTRGAVTQVNGTTGLSGVVSSANSLVGTDDCDYVGLGEIFELPNGSYVVSSPLWGGGPGCPGWLGAATWVDGATGATGTVGAGNSLIEIGSSSAIHILTNGNYLVSGANSLTWGSGDTGVAGAVSSANSLVGSNWDDMIGADVILLTNGNYLTRSSIWDNGSAIDAGAVTWGDGATGTSGVVSSANSLVGMRSYDNIGWPGQHGIPGVIPLANGNYVVISSIWDSPSSMDVGAVTWGNGTTGTTGVVSAINSLVGSSNTDWVGMGGVTALSNGNYVVSSSSWSAGRGAVTWGNGASGTTGTVSAANSLVGTVGGDGVGNAGVAALPNGNYLARSGSWNQGRGAVTWADGDTGLTGEISSANSLVGDNAGDQVGSNIFSPGGVAVLSNGNYVVSSPAWQIVYGQSVGAVTWGNASTGVTGVVSAVNSLIGNSGGDMIGLLRMGNPNPLDGIIPLSDGNYLVASGYWDNGSTPDVGAITWMDGSQPASGVVTAANSLIGSSAYDMIGTAHDSIPNSGIVELSNGKFVVASAYWDNGATQDAGAVTLINGAGGFSGNVVTPANSLVGSFSSDYVGSHGVTVLPNGSYVVRSGFWNNLAAGKIEAGALTWGSGSTGVTGVVSSANSLVGGSDLDRIGFEPLTVLSSSDYIVFSPLWDNGALADAGALTWGNGVSGSSGLISDSNSVLGIAAAQSSSMSFQAADNNQRLVIGRDLSQLVTIVELLPRLIVDTVGSGSGTVTSEPAGINCGTDCTELFNPDTLVTVTATPAGGSTFSGWSGACTGLVVCIITMDQAQSVTASFIADTHLLSVSLNGTGAGTVTSVPTGINCGADCTETYDYGATVTLTAAPTAGSIFSGWSGACSGTGDCILNIDGDKSVTATFTQDIQTYLLSVLPAGSGSGTVTSNPAGISCGADCSEAYTVNTLVTLTAAPAAGSVFAGWSGACSGTASCMVTMNSAKTVAATFNPSAASYTLTVSLAGAGSGTVTSVPTGINCGADCSETYLTGTLVALSALPAQGSVFTGWSGDCSGTGTCFVTMTAAGSVAATFSNVTDVLLFLPLVSAP